MKKIVLAFGIALALPLSAHAIKCTDMGSGFFTANGVCKFFLINNYPEKENVETTYFVFPLVSTSAGKCGYLIPNTEPVIMTAEELVAAPKDDGCWLDEAKK